MRYALTNTPTPDPAKRPAKPAPQPIHIVPRPKSSSNGLRNATSSSGRILLVALAVGLGILFVVLASK
jgi:hypothetical protein